MTLKHLIEEEAERRGMTIILFLEVQFPYSRLADRLAGHVARRAVQSKSLDEMTDDEIRALVRGD